MVGRFQNRWVILAAGFVVLFFSGGSRFAFGLMLKPMSEDLGWSRSSLSLAFASFMVVLAVALPFIGRLVDRHDMRYILATAGIVAAIGLSLMGMVNAAWQVILFYGVIYAIGNAGTSTAIIGVLIVRWFERGRGIATSVAVSGNAVGQLVIIALLASLLAIVGWRTTYVALGIAYLVILVPVVLIFIRAKSRSEREVAVEQDVNEAIGPVPAAFPMRSVLGSRQFWVLLAVFFICGLQDFFVATHIVAFALDQGVSPVLSGNILALMGVMGLLGVLLSGAMSDRFGAVLPTALCFLLRIAIFGFIVYFQSTAAIIVFALLYGLTFLITAPLTVIFAGNIFGTRRLGTISGLITMVHHIGGGLGAFIGGVMFETWGSYDEVFVLMFALSAVGMAFTMLIRERPVVPVTRMA
ncbi:MAG: MFS transporter [Chloroflexi bacterium]|nr:MFS transporter [Chloroflexota bacterium]